MLKVMKPLSVATMAGALLMSSMTGSLAQSSHEEHHPAEQVPAAPASPSQPESPAPMQKEGMGMMGGKDMPMMMKMMQEMHGMMMGGGMMAQPKGDKGPSSQALNGIIARMNQDIALPFSGNTDTDFVKRMISLHQGAIDIAKVELAFGKDADVRKVAEEVIKSNADDIAKMQEWLKKQ